VVDEETMRPLDGFLWFGFSDLIFSILAFSVVWQEGHPACNTNAIYPRGFFLEYDTIRDAILANAQ